MESMEEKRARIMAIEDPRKAYIAIATDREISLIEKEQLLDEYLKEHNVDEDEMAYYPNGERVLTPDMFW